jgi:hypothetical protein
MPTTVSMPPVAAFSGFPGGGVPLPPPSPWGHDIGNIPVIITGHHMSNPIPRLGIHPPNLTDSSFGTLYGAAKIVPMGIVSIGNRITTAIGAPGLSADAASIQLMPSGGSGAPRPVSAILPVWAKGILAKTRTGFATVVASLKR